MTTIIIPAFNAEKYLDAAISSVISQSDIDWELLLIDDGSTDSTPRICDKAADSDPRIRVIHTSNRGVSAARNLGLRHARGEFVAFLDADDILLPDFLEILTGALIDPEIQLAAAPFVRTKKPECYSPDHRGDANSFRLLTREESLRHLFYQTPPKGSSSLFDTSVWGKLYRRELWDGLLFREGQRFEDLDIFYKILTRISKIAFFPVPLLLYRLHSESFLHNFSSGRLDSLDVTDRMLDELSACGFKEKSGSIQMAARTRRFAAHCNMLLLILLRKLNDREAKRRCIKVIRQERAMVLNNREARLKDRAGALMAYLLF